MSLAAAMFGLLVLGPGPIPDDGTSAAPRPIPLTRPELKQMLEDMKARKPRLPLPEPAEGEPTAPGPGGGYEGRLRSLYLPAGAGGAFGEARPSGRRDAGGAGRRPWRPAAPAPSSS